ncbi:MAG: ammonium transporter [Candidatus Omnitrophota bacterium]
MFGKKKISSKIAFVLLIGAALVLAFSPSSFAEEEAPAYVSQENGNLMWMCIAAFLVFFMQAGFAAVECGFTRSKNSINIMMKNLLDCCIGSIVFWAIGFGLMFGTAAWGLIGTDGFGLFKYAMDGEKTNYWTYGFWMFQVVFAATAATIVSGAAAERTKFVAYLIYSAMISAFIYPIFGAWAWGGLFQGGGWLENLGFIDFAGSTVVHSVGGWAALAICISLGPRIGKYDHVGKPQALPGHNIPLAAMGVFILWLGWFGFNPGSTTTQGGDLAVIAVTTHLAACAGAFGALITAWIKFGKPDAGMTLNGVLAGLVGITAPCADVSPLSSIAIGFIAGIIVVIAVIMIENIGIDDPVGAISVHGVCGVWGTLAAGLFAEEKFSGHAGLFFGGGFHPVMVQLIGIISCFLWTFITSFVLFQILKATVGLRVSPEEELEGLDIGEHAGHAYSDFAIQR